MNSFRRIMCVVCSSAMSIEPKSQKKHAQWHENMKSKTLCSHHIPISRKTEENRAKEKKEKMSGRRYSVTNIICVLCSLHILYGLSFIIWLETSLARISIPWRESCVCGWWWEEMRSDRRRVEGRNRDCLVVRRRTSPCQQCVSFF